MSSEKTADFRQVALAFTQYLARREYDRAYRMTSRSYRRNTSAQQLQTVFEEIVPNDWGSTEPIEVVETMTSWEGKQASDLGWAYVSIYGDVYSEAITVVVASEENEAKVREVEFGRP